MSSTACYRPLRAHVLSNRTGPREVTHRTRIGRSLCAPTFSFLVHIHIITAATSHATASASLRSALDVTTHGTSERRAGSAATISLGLGLVALPLVGGLALCGPGVYGGDFVLEGGVDEAVALERREALELRGDDERGEGLAAAACKGRLTVSDGSRCLFYSPCSRRCV